MFRPLFRYTHQLVESLLLTESARAAIDALPVPRSGMNDLRESARRALLQAAHALDTVQPANYVAALQLASKGEGCPDDDLLQRLYCALTGRAEARFRNCSTLVYNQARTELIYIPPDAGDVPGLIAEVLDWLNSCWTYLPAVILAGIFHQELVLIQPFEQANAALARSAADMVLQRKGYGFRGYGSVETELADDPDAYEQAIRAAHSGVYANATDFTAWLEFYAAKLAAAGTAARATVQARFDSAQRPRVEAAPAALVLRSRQRQALEIARANGAIRSGEYQKLASIVPDTARRDFDELIDKGLIEVRGVGRGTHYVLTAQGAEEAQRKRG